METILQILPLAVLIVGAVVVVWRGLGQRPHDKGKIRGGGPDHPANHY